MPQVICDYRPFQSGTFDVVLNVLVSVAVTLPECFHY